MEKTIIKIGDIEIEKLYQHKRPTVKPLYSGYHRDFKIVSFIERCPLHRGFFQIGLFCFKNVL